MNSHQILPPLKGDDRLEDEFPLLPL